MSDMAAPPPPDESRAPAGSFDRGGAGFDGRSGGDPRENIQVWDYFDVFLRRKLLILLTLFVTVATAVFFSLQEKTVYSSSARLRIDEARGTANIPGLTRRDVSPTDTDIMVNADLPETLRLAAQKLIDVYKVDRSRYEKLTPEERAYVDSIMNNPDVAPGRMRNTFRLVSSDMGVLLRVIVERAGWKHLAPAVANAVARAITDGEDRRIRQRYEDMSETLQEQRRSIMVELDAVGKAIIEEQRRLEELGGDDASLSVAMMTSESSHLLNSLSRAEAERERLSFQKRRLEITIRRLREELKKPTSSSVPRELQERLDNLEMTEARYAEKYTDRHPKLVQVRSDIEFLKKHIKDVLSKGEGEGGMALDSPAGRQIEKSRLDLELTEARIAELDERITGLAKRLRALPTRELQLERLRRRRSVIERLLAETDAGIQAIEVALASGVSSGVRVVEDASGSRERKDNLVSVVLLGILIGLVLGPSLVLFWEHLDDTLHRPLDVLRVSGFPCLGLVPEVHSEDGQPLLISPAKPKSALAEIFAHMRNQVRFSGVGEPERLLLVASAKPFEGKSFIAANLAISYALEGNRVLLVDSDMRRSGLQDFIEVLAGSVTSERGLAAFLRGEFSFDDVLIPTAMDELCCVNAGHGEGNPSRQLRNPRMNEFLELACQRFDVVICDSPAVLPVVDAAVIAARMRGVLFTVNSGKTPVREINEALHRIQHVGGKVVGLVLNRAEEAHSRYFYGYPYSRYGYSSGVYGYGDTEDAKQPV